MPIPTTVDYAYRQVDIELLQSIVNPGPSTRVYPTFTRLTPGGYTVPKMVTGVEKAVQRYFKLLLTDIESVHFDEDQGGELVIRVFNGSIASNADLQHLFALANDSALSKLAEDDNNTTFGDSPDDERIVAASLANSTINPGTATVSLSIDITMASGQKYTYVIPITTGLQ